MIPREGSDANNPGARHRKFSMSDIAERKLWGKYVAAYENMIQEVAPRV